MAELDAPAWLARWEAQQAGHVPGRELVFGLMLDLVEGLRGAPARVLDLGCGPGSLAGRVLDRFPDATVVAVDADPVMLELGQRTRGDRIRWVHADLAGPDWADAVGTGFDAVVSATALHWLPADRLGDLARAVYGVLAPGGAFLDYDTLLADDTRTPRLGPVLTRLRRERTTERTSRPGFEDFRAWWAAARREPALAALARDPEPGSGSGGSTVTDWERALHAAGFTEVTMITQLLDRRLLVGLR